MSQTISFKGTFLGAGKPRKWGDDNYATKFWVDTDPDNEYPSQVELEVFKDRIDLSKFSTGDKVEVSINFKGKKSMYKEKERFFNSIDAWKMEKTGTTSSPSPPDNTSDAPDDDLPF